MVEGPLSLVEIEIPVVFFQSINCLKLVKADSVVEGPLTLVEIVIPVIFYKAEVI